METNYEHYKEVVNSVWDRGSALGYSMDDHKVGHCSEIDCKHCLFLNDKNGCGCGEKRWLVSEYKDQAEDVDWSKVSVDTPVLVRNDEDIWHKRYFAKYENGKKYVFTYGRTSWSDGENMNIIPCKYAKLANPEDCKSAFHAEEKELTKEERMEQLSAIYKDSCVKSAWKEMVEAVDEFWQSEIDDDKKDKIANMVMTLLKMEE